MGERIQQTNTASSKPGQGGWLPKNGAKLGLSVAMGILGAVGIAVAAPVVTGGIIIGAVCTGAATGLASFLGMSSAGTRKLIIPLLVGILALVATTPVHAAGSSSVFSESQALTRAAPSAATEGLHIGNGSGFFVAACAQSGATITGGTLKAWVYSYSAGLWMRNTDLDLTVGTPGTRCRAWSDQQVAASVGRRVLYTADSVTVSAGTAVTLRIEVWANEF